MNIKRVAGLSILSSVGFVAVVLRLWPDRPYEDMIPAGRVTRVRRFDVYGDRIVVITNLLFSVHPNIVYNIETHSVDNGAGVGNPVRMRREPEIAAMRTYTNSLSSNQMAEAEEFFATMEKLLLVKPAPRRNELKEWAIRQMSRENDYTLAISNEHRIRWTNSEGASYEWSGNTPHQ